MRDLFRHFKSAKREAKGLHARIKKFDFKLAIGNGAGLPDQLVQTLHGHRADALFVNVKSMLNVLRRSTLLSSSSIAAARQSLIGSSFEFRRFRRVIFRIVDVISSWTLVQ